MWPTREYLCKYDMSKLGFCMYKKQIANLSVAHFEPLAIEFCNVSFKSMMIPKRNS